MALAGAVLLALGLAVQAGKLEVQPVPVAPPPAASCLEAGNTVPPQRVTLDVRCDALRCPPGAHAEWVVTMGSPHRVRCVEGP